MDISASIAGSEAVCGRSEESCAFGDSSRFRTKSARLTCTVEEEDEEEEEEEEDEEEDEERVLSSVVGCGRAPSPTRIRFTCDGSSSLVDKSIGDSSGLNSFCLNDASLQTASASFSSRSCFASRGTLSPNSEVACDSAL